MDEPGARPRYWFPAKRYGWGWDLPSRWEGWAVLVAYGAAMTGAGIAGNLLRAPLGPVLAWAVFGISTVAFLFVCWRTGEPPRWQWGDRSRPGTKRR